MPYRATSASNHTPTCTFAPGAILIAKPNYNHSGNERGGESNHRYALQIGVGDAPPSKMVYNSHSPIYKDLPPKKVVSYHLKTTNIKFNEMTLDKK